MPFNSIFSTSVLLVFRGHHARLVVFFILFLTVTVLAAAQFSGRQPVVVSLDVGISVIRFAIPIFVFFLFQDLIFKEFELRYFLNSFSYPGARMSFLLCRFLAVISSGFLLLLLLSVVLAALVHLVEFYNPRYNDFSLGFNYLVVMIFISVELFVLAAMACFLSVVSSSSSFMLAAACGFTLIARSYASVISLLADGQGLVGSADIYSSGLGMMGYLLPDLSAFDLRVVALYGRWEFIPDAWPFLVVSGFGYSIGFLALAVWALNRRRFV